MANLKDFRLNRHLGKLKIIYETDIMFFSVKYFILDNNNNFYIFYVFYYLFL